MKIFFFEGWEFRLSLGFLLETILPFPNKLTARIFFVFETAIAEFCFFKVDDIFTMVTTRRLSLVESIASKLPSKAHYPPNHPHHKHSTPPPSNPSEYSGCIPCFGKLFHQWTIDHQWCIPHGSVGESHYCFESIHSSIDVCTIRRAGYTRFGPTE